MNALALKAAAAVVGMAGALVLAKCTARQQHGCTCPKGSGCRPARPLCRAMRRVQPSRRPCYCGVYHFPHRAGSCKAQENRMNLEWLAWFQADEKRQAKRAAKLGGAA